MKYILLFLSVISLSYCSEPPKKKIPVYYNIRSLIGKSPSEIEAALGKPSEIKTKKIDCGLKRSECNLEYTFERKNIVVQFSDNKAYYFEFNKITDYEFNDDMHQMLGLEKGNEKVLPNNKVVWFNYPDIQNIAFIESDYAKGYIDYIVVSAIK